MKSTRDFAIAIDFTWKTPSYYGDGQQYNILKYTEPYPRVKNSEIHSSFLELSI